MNKHQTIKNKSYTQAKPAEGVKMNDTQALLEFIYKNAEMGRKTLAPISDMNTNEEFGKTVSRLLGQFAEICSEADRELNSLGWDKAEGLSGMEKFMTEMALKMNTIKDKSVPHLADMILKGASMGVTDISKKLSEYVTADENAKELALKLRKLNSDVIDDMKKYLIMA